MVKGLGTALYLSIFSFFYIYLASRVILLRRKHRQEIEAGEHPDLARAIRCHANASENFPLIILLMLCYELVGGHVFVVHLLGISLIISRLLHFIGFGFKKGVSFGRTYGMILNYVIIISLAFLNIWEFIESRLV